MSITQKIKMVIKMTNNKEYWRKRFTELEKAQNKQSDKYLKLLKEEYDKSLIKIEKDITNWYTRIADNNEISYTEAKKLLDKKELKEFKWTVEEYIEKGKENAINQKWMKELENSSARVHIEELNAIKIQIQNELENLYDRQNKGVENLLKQQYEDTYYKSIYEIQKGLNQFEKVQKINTEKINKIISKPWTTDNQTFSDRIWKNKNELVNTLQKELTQATIRGDDIHKVTKKIEKDFEVSKGKAGRLVMTESAFFSSAGQKESFNSLNVKQYEIVATLDTHTSEICQKLDGKVFDMKDYEVGITAPPFHCWCRSVTAPYFNDEFTEGEQRIYRDEERKSGYVDSKMSYQEWHNKYVENEIKFKVKKKPKHIYTKVQLEEMAKKANNIVKNYTNNESKWSGNIILTKNKTVKEWNCDISVDEYCSLDMLIHEQLHSHSISYYDRQTYKENWKIEEATVQLLTQEICKRNKISYIESEYDKMVNTLRAINKKAKLYKNDLKLAKELIKIPVTERIDFLQQKVYNKAIENISVEEYQKIFKKIEEFLI